MITLQDLRRSPVTFDEPTHTYTAPDGLPLSGVTSIIGATLFPDKYSGIPAAILQQAAERGTKIHNECEQYNIFGEGIFTAETSPQAREYARLIQERGIEMIANEYLVSDEVHVATMIDCIDQEGNLYDIKTTHRLDTDSLAWQLSFCDWLFTKQNPDLERPSRRLFGIWLRVGRAEIVEVGRKSDAEIEEVLQAFLQGRRIALPEHIFSAPEEQALLQLTQQEEMIIQFKQAIDQLEAEKKKNLDLLQEKMKAEGISKLETPRLLVTRVAPTTSLTLDSKRLKEEEPEIYKQYSKLTARKPYVKITLR